MNDTHDLWTSNALARTLSENLDQGVMGLDHQYRVRIWNPWLVSHTGLSAEVVEYRLLKEIFPDLPPFTLQTIKEVLSAGQPRLLSPILHSNWFPAVKAKHQLIRLLPLLAEDRQTTGVIIFIQDLTGAVDYEGGLEERYRTLVESFSDHIFMLDPDGIYLTSNGQVKQFDFENVEALVGKHYSDVYPDDVAELYCEQIEKVLSTGREVRFEHEMPGPDGPGYHINTLYPIQRDKQVWALGGICRDITQRKIYEKELAIRNKIAELFLTTQGDETYGEVLQTILESLESRYGIFGYIDEDGAMVCPSMTREIWEACQVPDKTMVFPRETWGGIWGRAMTGSKTLCSNEALTVPEGHLPIQRVLASPILHEGKAIGILEVANKTEDYHRTDIQLLETIAHTIAPILYSRLQLSIKEREKERIENQLHQSQKMEAIGLLAGGVAHDFNNLLSIIIGNAEIISMDTSEHSPFKSGIEEIGRAGNRAASLIRQLLMFSRKQIVRPEIVSLNDILTGLEKMLQRLIGEDIRFVTVKAPDLRPVSMDPGQLEQVVMNLVVNGRDAMPRGGSLTMETANADLDEAFFKDRGPEPATGPYAMLRVSDSGVGMDKETQSRIFEPFFTTKVEGQGTGLGLATVYGIVKKAKGYVWVYSEPGKGTTFKIYLPMAGRGEETGKTEAVPVQQITGTETILLVEDDVALQGLMKKVLEGHGYRVLGAGDGEAAIALSETHEGEVELLLTDVVLPGIGGKDLSDALQEKRPEMKIIFVSGYTDDIILRYGVVPKDVDFLEKPFTPKSLALKVREVLNRV